MKKENWEETTQRFHDLYEKYAPEFGYTTREDTKQLDFNSNNGKLMLKVVSEVITQEIAKTKEDIVEKAEELIRCNSIDNHDVYYNQAIDDIINLIQNNK